MAQLIGDILFTGSLQKLSAYKMRGSDKIILRKKGGPSREQIKNSPRFDLTRRNNVEFGGRATAAKKVKHILWPLQFLADYNFTGPLNALLKPIQAMDTTSGFGQRNILLSQNPRLLEGFTLNRRFLFDTIVRNPIAYTLSKDSLQATIDIPALMPNLNFVAPGNYQWYRFIGVMGIVPDLFYTAYGYKPMEKYEEFFPEIHEEDWLPVNSASAPVTISLQGNKKPKTSSYSCMLAIGIAFGTMIEGRIEPVKYIGGAKIVAVR
jgi:hypothetical protein